jgi:hypothetical protein
MAFVATAITEPTRKGRGLKLDGYVLEIQAYAKDSGDTTGTVTCTKLRRVHSIEVYNSDGALIAASATITNASAGFASVALTALGDGTAGVVVVKGSKK